MRNKKVSNIKKKKRNYHNKIQNKEPKTVMEPSLSSNCVIYDLTDSQSPKIQQEIIDLDTSSNDNVQPSIQQEKQVNKITSKTSGGAILLRLQDELCSLKRKEETSENIQSSSKNVNTDILPTKKVCLQMNPRVEEFLKTRFPFPSSTKKIESILNISKSKANGTIMCLVKFFNRSYLECEWVPAKEISDLFLQAEIKKRDDAKLYAKRCTELYNPICIIPESILAKMKGMYLVKWLGLSYSHSTWETNMVHVLPNLDRLIRRYDTPESERVSRIQLTESQNMVVDDIMYKLAGKKNFIVSIETHPKVERILQIVSAFQDIKQVDPTEKKRFLVLTQTFDCAKVWEQIVLEKTWLNCVLYHGSNDDLNIIKELFLSPSFDNNTGRDVISNDAPFDIIIMTNMMFINNYSYFINMKWTCVFMDSSLMLKVDPFCNKVFMMLNDNYVRTDSFGLMVDNGDDFITRAEGDRPSIRFMLINGHEKESFSSMLISSAPIGYNFIHLAISNYTDLQMEMLKSIFKRKNTLNIKQLFREMEKCTVSPFLLARENSLSNADIVESSGILSSFSLIFDKIDKTGPTTIAVFSKCRFIITTVQTILSKKGVPTKIVTPFDVDKLPQQQTEPLRVFLCDTTGVVLSPFKNLDIKAAIFFDEPSPFSDIFCFNNKDISIWYILISNSYKKRIYDIINERFGHLMISLNALFTLDETMLTKSQIEFMYIKNVYNLFYC